MNICHKIAFRNTNTVVIYHSQPRTLKKAYLTPITYFCGLKQNPCLVTIPAYSALSISSSIWLFERATLREHHGLWGDTFLDSINWLTPGKLLTLLELQIPLYLKQNRKIGITPNTHRIKWNSTNKTA